MFLKRRRILCKVIKATESTSCISKEEEYFARQLRQQSQLHLFSNRLKNSSSKLGSHPFAQASSYVHGNILGSSTVSCSERVVLSTRVSLSQRRSTRSMCLLLAARQPSSRSHHSSGSHSNSNLPPDTSPPPPLSLCSGLVDVKPSRAVVGACWAFRWHPNSERSSPRGDALLLLVLLPPLLSLLLYLLQPL